MKVAQLFSLLFFWGTVMVIGQQQKPLSDQLWGMAQQCKELIEDEQVDDWSKYDTLINNVKNGYLKISGEYPTCGCYCSATVGAYKDDDNNYILLKQQREVCNWSQEIVSNKPFRSIFPREMIDGTLFFEEEITADNNSDFYVAIRIPKKGTITRVRLNMVPIGMHIKGAPVVFSYSEIGSEPKSLLYIQRLVNELKNKNTLQSILDSDFEKIDKTDQTIIKQLLAAEEKDFNSLTLDLSYVKRKYDLYKQVQFSSVTLDWNRKMGKFYVLEKHKVDSIISFKEFILKIKFWTAIC